MPTDVKPIIAYASDTNAEFVEQLLDHVYAQTNKKDVRYLDQVTVSPSMINLLRMYKIIVIEVPYND